MSSCVICSIWPPRSRYMRLSPTWPIATRLPFTSSPTMVWTRAVLRMPRCWMANTTNIRIAPMKNVELTEMLTMPKMPLTNQ